MPSYPLRLLVLASWAAVSAACYSGSSGRSGFDPVLTAGTSGLGSGDEQGSETGGGPDASGGQDEEPQSAPTLPTRRLTHSQYDSIVADLVGDDTQPASELSPDAKAYGYDSNGEGELISLLQAEQYETVADGVARRAMANLAVVVGCSLDSASETGCVDAFVQEFGKKAFRRPLTLEEYARLRELYNTQRLVLGPEDSIRILIKTFLMSPQFLYRIEPADPTGGVDAWVVASRLSFLLWNTMPDEELFGAASDGELDTAAGVEQQARRMLDDPRAEDMLVDFHRQWLLLDWVFTAAKDDTVFPEYTPQIQALLVQETESFIADTVLQGEGSIAALLSASHTFLTPELAAYYGLPSTGGVPGVFAKVEVGTDRAAGLLTQGAFLSAHSTSTSTSPVRRGKFVRERLLCGEVPPPPPGVEATPPSAAPNTTTRERYGQHSEDPICATCHQLMDPIGLGFEHYDAIGRWRDTEGGREIDASTELVGVDQHTDGAYGSLTELASALGDSPTTRACVAKQWFRYAYGRDDAADDYVDLVRALQTSFDESDGDIAELVVSLTQTELFLGGRT